MLLMANKQRVFQKETDLTLVVRVFKDRVYGDLKIQIERFKENSRCANMTCL